MSAPAAVLARPARRWSRPHPALARLAFIASLLVIWEVAARRFGDPLFVSPPSRVLQALFALVHNRDVMMAVALTAWEILAAFVLSVAIGLALGLAVGLSRFTRGSIYPIILLLYALPQATILPLFVLVFGIGAASKIAFGVSHGAFPLILTVAASARRIDPVLATSARSMGAGRRQMLRSVIFPQLLPGFFTGMRLAMAAVLLGVLLAELYVSQSGIGFFTTMFTQTFQPQNLFALVLVLAGIAVALNELCRWAERRFSRWRA